MPGVLGDEIEKLSWRPIKGEVSSDRLLPVFLGNSKAVHITFSQATQAGSVHFSGERL